jgi:hypothetical protein
MKQHQITLALKQISLGIGLVLTATVAPAATVVFYDFDDGAATFTNAVENKAAEITAASSWSVNSNSILSDTGAAGGQSRSIKVIWDDAQQFFEFSFDIASGFQLALDNVTFFERFGGASSGGGAKKAFSNGWNLFVNGIEKTSGPTGLDREVGDGGSPTVTQPSDSFRQVSLDKSLSVLNLTGTVVIRLTGDTPVPGLKLDGTAYPPGDWRVDDFTLSGTFSPIPVPGALWLMGSALAGLAVRRRRISRS